MTKPIEFDQLAREEYLEASAYLENARRGYGDIFEEHFERILDMIAAHPRMHAANRDGVRKALIKKFHYNIIYREEFEHIRIISVFHTSRNPREWQKRV